MCTRGRPPFFFENARRRAHVVAVEPLAQLAAQAQPPQVWRDPLVAPLFSFLFFNGVAVPLRKTYPGSRLTEVFGYCGRGKVFSLQILVRVYAYGP